MTTAQPAPDTALAQPRAGMTAREEFNARELAVSGETAVTAVAAQARAMVEARYVMALRRPRDMDEVRQRLLAAIENPGFAGREGQKTDGEAWFELPFGQDRAEGFTIRFAEEAALALGNIESPVMVVWESATSRIVVVTVSDLERNIHYPSTFVLSKTVERKFLKKGQVALSSRTNSQGETTHTVAATEDEVARAQNARASKEIRNNVMRLVPGYIKAECKRRILEIRHGAIAKDLDGARRKILDAFFALNIPAGQLKQFLGHDLAVATPAEIDELRAVHAAIKGGTATWVEALAEKLGVEPEPPKPDPLLQKAAPKPEAQAEREPPDPEPVYCKAHPDVNDALKPCWKCAAEKADAGPEAVKAVAAAAQRPRGQKRLEE